MKALPLTRLRRMPVTWTTECSAAPSSIEGFARELYSALRFADAQGLTKICVIQPEGDGLAAAIRDRLKRAAN